MIPKKVFLPPPSLWTPFANQPNATMVTFLSDRSVASERPQQTRRPRDKLIAGKVARQRATSTNKTSNGQTDRRESRSPGRPRPRATTTSLPRANMIANRPCTITLLALARRSIVISKRGTTLNDHFLLTRPETRRGRSKDMLPPRETVAHDFPGGCMRQAMTQQPPGNPTMSTTPRGSASGFAKERIQSTPVAVGTISKCGSAKDEIHLVKNEKRSLLFISSLHLFHLLLLLKLSLPEKREKNHQGNYKNIICP